MRLRILGPLEIRDRREQPLNLGRAKERVLLAMLVLRVNTMLPKESITAGLWGERPPRSADSNLASYVSNLRRVLTAEQDASLLIETELGGYRLVATDPADIDTLLFEQLADDGKQARAGGRPALAVEQLTRAAGLWRGPVMAGLPVPEQFEADISRLEDLRLTVIEDSVDSRLELGQHAVLTGELASLTAKHEFRERLWGQRMLALYRSGRQTDALTAYQAVRRLLQDQLGVEPGSALRRLHEQILRADPILDLPDQQPAILRPKQLPAAVSAFTGRTTELTKLSNLLAGGAGSTTMLMAAIVGSAGTGKTALAVHWAHQVADRFPDGQLYVDLHGFGTNPPAQPIDVLTAFLRALGMGNEQIPTDEAAAAATYRSMLADRKVLVILDNAGSANQVRPLLPGSGTCAVVITSRSRLTGLVALDGAEQVVLTGLRPSDTHDLLVRVLGADRVRREPAAAANLGHLCAHLPLALRLAAARVASTDLTLAGYVAELETEHRLDLLAVADEPNTVRTMFDASYRLLADDAKQLFRLLGLTPGHGFTERVAAALLDVPPARAKSVLTLLISASLVERRGAEQFVLHDLLLLYAKEKVASDEPEARQSSIRRLMRCYLRDTRTAMNALDLGIARMTIELAASELPSLRLDGHAEALAWLDSQRDNLVAAVVHAAENGPRPIAWQLCDQLRGYFWVRRCMPEWLRTGHAAVAAARTEEDIDGEIMARHCLGDAYWSLGEYPRAIDHYRHAIGLCAHVDLPDRHAGLLINVGAVHRERGELEPAADHLRAALDIKRRNGLSEFSVRANLGLVYQEMGRFADSAVELQSVVKLGTANEKAMSMTWLGATYRMMGQLDRAIAHDTESLALHQEAGNRPGEANALEELAAATRDSGDLAKALSYAEVALDLARGIANPRAEAAALTTLASIHLRRKDYPNGYSYYNLGLQSARTARIHYLEVNALLGLAAAQRFDQPDTAAKLSAEALLATQHAGFQFLEAMALTLLAELANDQNDPKAADYAHHAVRIHESIGCRPGVKRATAALHHVTARVAH